MSVRPGRLGSFHVGFFSGDTRHTVPGGGDRALSDAVEERLLPSRLADAKRADDSLSDTLHASPRAEQPSVDEPFNEVIPEWAQYS
jgi:hypothetical protein